MYMHESKVTRYTDTCTSLDMKRKYTYVPRTNLDAVLKCPSIVGVGKFYHGELVWLLQLSHPLVGLACRQKNSL